MTNYITDKLPEVPEDEQLFKIHTSFYGTGEFSFSDIEPVEKGRDE